MSERKIDANRLAIGLLLAVALLAPASTLFGWTFGIAFLRGFGDPNYAVAPLTVALFGLIALGMLLTVLERIRTAQILLLLPALAASLIAVQYLTRIDFGLQSLLFAQGVQRYHVLNRGVPGGGAVLVLGLGIVATWLVGRPGLTRNFWALVIASGALALTTITTSITLLDAPADIDPAFIGRSTLTALPSIALNLAVILRGWQTGGDLRTRPGWRLLWQMTPAIIVLPAMPPLAMLVAHRSGLVSFPIGQFLVALGNVLLLGSVLLYAMRQATRQTRELVLREAELRSILETIPDAMVVADGDGMILAFNAAAERYWGYGSDAVVGRSFGELLSANSRERYEAMLAAFRATGIPMFRNQSHNGVAQRRDGSLFPMEARIGVVSADGTDRFVIFLRDMSDALEAEDHVAELNYQLVHLSRVNAMGEFAADMAHELNQPLSAAANFLAAATMFEPEVADPDPHSDHALMRRAGEQIQRAGDIIRRLREFTARHEVNKRSERLEPLIEDAAQLVLVGSGRFDVELAYDLDPGAARVFADRIQVQQVIVNLLRNAIEAVRTVPGRHPRVRIASRLVGEQMVELSFVDNGPGVPKSVIERLGTRFVADGVGVGKGMGIGLSISYRIVEGHGGALSVRNLPEGGARFAFTLPLSPSEAVA